MASGAHTPKPSQAASLGVAQRRNRAEWRVRERLDSNDDVYVYGSSWLRGELGSEPCVAVIARNDDARYVAQSVLEDFAGLHREQWREAWTPLSLGDWMIWIYPERTT